MRLCNKLVSYAAAKATTAPTLIRLVPGFKSCVALEQQYDLPIITSSDSGFTFAEGCNYLGSILIRAWGGGRFPFRGYVEKAEV